MIRPRQRRWTAAVFAALVPLALVAAGDDGHPLGSFVAIGKSRLWVESEGAGAGAPLVLIPGGPGLAHDYFHPFFSQLAATSRVIYFDPAGRGRSDGVAAYTFSRDVAELEALRQALGLRTMSLFGHSYGGMVAVAYALQHPAAVERLIVADTHWSGASWQASNDACNARIRKELLEVWQRVTEMRAKGLKSNGLGDAYRTPPGLYFFSRNHPKVPGMALAANPAVYYGIAGDDADFELGGELARLDFRPRMKDLKMPVLALGGRHDQVVPVEQALAVPGQAPRGEVLVLEQSGHFPFIEETDGTMAAIRRFLAGGK
ncbi:MAG TPA: alpha/beta fold hydrolase [Thermoanaerobaculia bacterium]|nr:alpha/beta fold hydrolase [Thermoanaerobaculia bacterium]